MRFYLTEVHAPSQEVLDSVGSREGFGKDLDFRGGGTIHHLDR